MSVDLKMIVLNNSLTKACLILEGHSNSLLIQRPVIMVSKYRNPVNHDVCVYACNVYAQFLA